MARSAATAWRTARCSRWAALLLAALTATCAPQSDPCREDADCPDGVCLHDLDRGDRYCSRACDDDDVCAEAQRCAVHLTGAPGDEDVLYMCVERVRACGEAEHCNGLDDDCDGEIDEDCTLVPCSTDLICGGLWPCAPAPEVPDYGFVCLPPRLDGAPAGEPCTAPSGCFNDLCEVGACASICKDDADCSADDRCARASLPSVPQPHGTCHLPCDAASPCPPGMSCTIRPNPWQCRWRPVCSPARGAGDYGDACDDHDDCASALCLGGRCTRPCATFVDCQGLWPGSGCVIFGLSADPLTCDLDEVAACL